MSLSIYDDVEAFISEPLDGEGEVHDPIPLFFRDRAHPDSRYQAKDWGGDVAGPMVSLETIRRIFKPYNRQYPDIEIDNHRLDGVVYVSRLSYPQVEMAPNQAGLYRAVDLAKIGIELEEIGE